MTQNIFIQALAKAIVQFKKIHKQKNKSNMTKPTINLSGVWQAIHTGVIKITTFLKAHILDAVSIGNAIKEIAAGGNVVDASIEAIIEVIPGGKGKTEYQVKALASAIQYALKSIHVDDIAHFVLILRGGGSSRDYKAALIGKFVTIIIQQMHGDPTIVTEIYDLLRVAGYADTEGLEQLDIEDKPTIQMPASDSAAVANASDATTENVHANTPDGTVDKTKPYFKDGAWVNP